MGTFPWQVRPVFESADGGLDLFASSLGNLREVLKHKPNLVKCINDDHPLFLPKGGAANVDGAAGVGRGAGGGAAIAPAAAAAAAARHATTAAAAPPREAGGGEAGGGAAARAAPGPYAVLRPAVLPSAAPGPYAVYRPAVLPAATLSYVQPRV